MKTRYVLLAALTLVMQFAAVGHAQTISWDFQDGTDQGWSGPFSDADGDVSHVLTDVNGDGNLWLSFTNTGSFSDNAGFTQSNDPTSSFNAAFYAAVNNPTDYLVQYDYTIDTSAGTDGTFFQLTNFFQSGSPGFSFVRPSPNVVELGGADLAAADVFTGTASFVIPAGLTGSDEQFARFGFSTNGDASDVAIFVDNISISPVSAIPEPSALGFVSLGILGFASSRRRRIAG